MLICKCCYEEARWCSDGEKACGTEGCDHIHCDHYGTHCSLESSESSEAETGEEAKTLMLKAYLKTENLNR